MLLIQPPQLLAFLLPLLALHTAHARPKISEEFRELLESRYHYLDKRQCANPCGWSGQVCCGASQTCSTNSLGQAVCLNGGASQAGNVALADAPGVETYVTTIIQSGLVTKTTTYTRSFGAQQTGAAVSAQAALSCSLAMGEKPCGSICCAAGQYCVYAGQCGASGDQAGSSSSVLGQVFTPVATNTAPLRPTSNAAVTVTTRGSITTTVAFSTPTSASATAAGGAAGVTSTNNGLSGGAIAGIVIGVLAGIILLILLIFCCCAATVGNAILAALGCGGRRKKKTEVTYIEEHSHHHSGGGGAKPPRRWYGLLPPRNDAPKKKKSSGVGGLTAVVGGLGTLAVLLGIKRKVDKKKTEYSGSSYYSDYSYYDSSESSSDRYTRRTGRSASRR